ncbi:MAG: septum formation protein Maf [Sphingobacteriia bacterium]|nr:septum formation protein Maf [Sphingobacteriia bacterium]
MKEVILASQSPRRKQLLEWAEVPFTVMVANTDETYPPGLPVGEIPVFIAREKAKTILQKISREQLINCSVIAADTIVVLDNEILGKPDNRDHAIATIQKLSGRKHLVITGVVIIAGEKEISFAETTEVEFHPLTDEEILFYVNKYQPYDKAGAYAIQEWIGVVGIKKINGDFYNVMGLPVSRVIKALQNM